MAKFLRILFLLGTLVLPVRAAEKPHIIFILADDMGYGDLGCYGGKLVATPRLDRFADEGLRFTQYYSASPICSPSRTGLLTGAFPARWRITSFLSSRKANRAAECTDFLDAHAPSLARTLQGAGYATGHFGKWHMGGGRDVHDAPAFEAYGFDEHASTWESPDPHPDLTATNWIWSPRDNVKRWNRTAFFVDKALDFLRRHKDSKPCFVDVWPDDIHTPWVPRDDAPSGSTPANLRAVLAEFDRQVGRLLDGLDELGIARETIVVFASDNGPEPTFDHARTAGLRGMKWSLYEGGIRMPFILRWPGHVPAGQVDSATVLGAVDLFPSVCAMAKVEPPRDASFDGEDMSAAFSGAPHATRKSPLFWEYGRNAEAFPFPGKKGGSTNDRSPNVAMRDGPWKLLVNADGSGVELYDLDHDANETRNLVAESPDLARELVHRALAWRQSLPKLDE